jgi:acetyl esterase/lipase
MLELLIWLMLILAAFWAFTRFYLQGEDLTRYDRSIKSSMRSGEPSKQHYVSIDAIAGFLEAGHGNKDRKTQLADSRTAMDAMGDDADLTGVELLEVKADGVLAEWVIAEGAHPDRRILYIHGGAFMMGSPRSHRWITTTLSRIANASVLAIDYRLTPEHSRIACIEDCQTAYKWLLENGPEGRMGAPDAFYVAGDSAGGNLALMTIAWARDAGLRAVNAAVALSPLTDSTFGSPSMRSNVVTDHMLGSSVGPITKVPKIMLPWVGLMMSRVRPSDPRVSPVYGDLAGLPPTLVQASEAEMLLDDARRWVNKASDAGTEVTLETWPHVLHVWHLFGEELPEAREAFESIGRFLEIHSPKFGGTS